ncbi:MAG: Uma2 family endonuclease [Bacteroidota bacterium]
MKHPLINYEEIVYPETDGKPMAENTKQLNWIVQLYSNLRALFSDQEVFVAADLFWYPVEGSPKIVQAPDVMVIFGRPDGDRPSYQQWREEDIPPQVVIEVLSPSNRPIEMVGKQKFYEKYGVEEYIIIDPETEEFTVYLREADKLIAYEFPLVKWQSPTLGIWLKIEEGKLKALYPDESPFRILEELKEELDTLLETAERERQRAEAESQRAEAESQRAEAESQRAEKERTLREASEAKAQALLARLRELGEDID